MGLFSKKDNANGKKGFNVYSFITSLAIVIAFIAIALLVLAVRGFIRFRPAILLTILTMFVVALTALLSLPWVRRLQNKQHRIISWVFLGLLVLSAVFWLIFGFLLVINFSKLKTDAVEVIRIINYLKFCIIYTIAYSVSSLITTNILKFGKRLIAFQVILYVSDLIVGIYITLMLCCIHFNAKTFVSFNFDMLLKLVNPVFSTIFMIAVIYVAIAKTIAKRLERRRERYAKSEDDMPEEVLGGQTQQKPATAQEKLAELQTMYEQNLITQEEYNKKRTDILNKM